MVTTRVTTRKREAESMVEREVNIHRIIQESRAECARKHIERETWLAAGPPPSLRRAKAIAPPKALPFTLVEGDRRNCTLKYRSFSICPMVCIKAVRGVRDRSRPWGDAPLKLSAKVNATLVFGIKMHRVVKSPFGAPEYTESYIPRLSQNMRTMRGEGEMCSAGTVREVNGILDAMPVLRLPEAVYHVIRAFVGDDDGYTDIVEADGLSVYMK